MASGKKLTQYDAIVSPELGMDDIIGVIDKSTGKWRKTTVKDFLAALNVVTKLNGKTGEFTLHTDDLSDVGKANKFVSQAEKDKIAKIYTSGDGSKVLANNGQYIVVSTGGGEVPVVEAFDDVLTFNKNKYMDTALSQAGSITYTLAASGHIDGKIIRHKILTDGNPISFPDGAFVYPAGFTLQTAVVYEIWFSYLGGDLIVNIPGAQSSTGSNTAPTVSNPIADQTKTEGYISFTVDLSTVFSDADGDALTYSASSSNTALVTASVSGSTLTVTEQTGTGGATITVSANDGKGGVSNDSFELTVSSSVAPLLSDDFTGTTIDTTKWTVTDPADELAISQNETIKFHATGVTSVDAYANNMIAATGYTDALQVLAADFIFTNTPTNNFFFELRVDANNTVRIVGDISSTSRAKARLLIVQGGLVAYDLKSSIDFNNKRWKIKKDGSNNISFFYWDGAAWVQVGVTQTVNIGTTFKPYMSMSGVAGDVATMEWDNLRLTNYDYTTRLP